MKTTPPTGHTDYDTQSCNKKVCVFKEMYLWDAHSLPPLYGFKAELSEFFIVHRLGQVVDTQTILRYKHTNVPKLGPLYFFKLGEETKRKIYESIQGWI